MLVTIPANAANIGVWGGDFSTWSGYITASGNTAFQIDENTNSAAYGFFDQVWLIRQDGNQDVIDYVDNGGTLVTEWSAGGWAVDASMLDASSTLLGSIGTDTEVTFTTAGIASGLGASTGNPYSNGLATEFFYSFSDLGNGVYDLAQIDGGHTVGIGGAYGNGTVVALGWDWSDSSYAHNPVTQQLVNDIVEVSIVPIPAAVWLFGSALAGLGWMRRKRTT